MRSAIESRSLICSVVVDIRSTNIPLRLRGYKVDGLLRCPTSNVGHVLYKSFGFRGPKRGANEGGERKFTLNANDFCEFPRGGRVLRDEE